MSAAWSLAGVTVQQGGRKVLDGASLEVAAGEVVGVLGPNGAGKTTLIRAGLGLAAMEQGEAKLAGNSLASLSEADRAALVGYLPQERRVAWNVPAWRAAALGAPFAPPVIARERALEALGQVGLSALAERGVLDMSGGERARVLLARLLATRAPLLVADEPGAGLDPDAQLMFMARLRTAAEAGAAVCVTLHDLTVAARYCDRLVVLSQGRVEAEGDPGHALAPAILARVFGLSGELVSTKAGVVLAAKRFED